MNPQIFKRTLSSVIIFAAFGSAFSLSVFGQKAVAQDCAGADYNCLIARYSQAIEKNPKDAEAFYNRGFNFIQLKLYADAIKDFNRVKELVPANKDADGSLAYIYEMIKRGNLPIEEYDKLILLEPNNAEYYNARSKLLYKAEKFDKAIEDADRAIELDQNYTDAYFSRALGYCKIGERKKSMADIAKRDQLTGKKTNGICWVDIKVCVGKNDDCRMDVFTDGINNPSEIGPGIENNLGDFYVGRGVIYYKRGDSDRALSDFEDADRRKYFTEIFEKNFLQGSVYLRKGKFDEALKKFILAAYLKRDSAESYLGVGEIYLIKREYDAAFKNYEIALFLNPRIARAYLGRGTIYLERGRIYEDFENNREKAIEAYKNAVKDFDSVTGIDLKEINPEVYLRRAKTYERLGEQEKAEADRAKYKELADKP